MIDPTSPVPIYHQLATMLRSQIDAGVYPDGIRLPTELELCQRYGISRTPARRALTTLAEQGVIERFKRRGSFVSTAWQPGPGTPVDVFDAGTGDESR